MSEATAEKQIREKKHHSLYAELIIRLVKEKPLGTFGAVIVLIFFLVAVFANSLAPYPMDELNLADRLEPPSGNHILGTDQLGRDLLSRIIYGARISMSVGLASSAIAVFLAIFIGMFSGFWGGKIDLVVQRFVDAWMCLPALFLVLTVMSVLGQGLWQVIFVLGLQNGIANSRVVRSAVIGIKENMYVQSARAIGDTSGRLMSRHILPNILAPIIILFTITMGHVIIVEATISFLGFGVPPPNPSWGGMLSGEGRKYMLEATGIAFWPGLALAIVVYGINMLGDALRDILDPRLKGGLGRYDSARKKRSPAK